jgi:hypothetical protein
MTKTNKFLQHSSSEEICTDWAFVNAPFAAESISRDQRIGQLILLLQQLNEASGGLGSLPKPELMEVLFSAVGVCGFVNPTEVQDVIATVLDAVEMEDPIPARSFSPTIVPPD